MAEGEDLSVTGVAGGEDPSEPVENKANQSRKQGHERGTLSVSPMPETSGITARMNLRHAQANVSSSPMSLSGSHPTLVNAITQPDPST